MRLILQPSTLCIWLGAILRMRLPPPNVVIHGFLRKDKAEEKTKLDMLRTIADFFILPTRAECSAIAFCEASAYGIPIITYDTGGVGDYVIQGYNGFRLPLEKDGTAFAEKILECSRNPELLKKLKVNARKMYEECLNWDTSCENIKKYIDRMIE